MSVRHVFELIRDWKQAKGRMKVRERGTFIAVEDVFMYMVNRATTVNPFSNEARTPYKWIRSLLG